MRELINSGLSLSMMAIDGIDGHLHRHSRGKREEGEEPVSRNQVQPECGESAN